MSTSDDSFNVFDNEYVSAGGVASHQLHTVPFTPPAGFNAFTVDVQVVACTANGANNAACAVGTPQFATVVGAVFVKPDAQGVYHITPGLDLTAGLVLEVFAISGAIVAGDVGVLARLHFTVLRSPFLPPDSGRWVNGKFVPEV